MFKKGLLLITAFTLVAAACGDQDTPPPPATPEPAPTVPSATTQPPATAAPATPESAPAGPSATTQPPAIAAPAQPPAAAGPTTTAVAAPIGTTVLVSPSSFGDILTDGDGNTLYLFMPDNAGPSVCNDQCAESWPPLVDDVTAGAGLDASLLGTATRQDGAEQATYNGWPLYHFSNDSAPGDTNGQGVSDVWWTISPSGHAARAPSADPYGY